MMQSAMGICWKRRAVWRYSRALTLQLFNARLYHGLPGSQWRFSLVAVRGLLQHHEQANCLLS